MAQHPLDNPIWNSLVTNHAHLAIGDFHARRYPSAVAPFIAVDSTDASVEADILDIVSRGEHVCVLSLAPPFSGEWDQVKEVGIVQMILEEPAKAEPDSEIVLLSLEDRPAMLDLTSLVYPAYFREGTAELGNYFGIKREGRLCAMAGIRMSMLGYQEISAVCTHPDFQSRGYARRLIHHLVAHIQANGNIPFLHTEEENERARALYGKLGFTLRRILPFWVLDRK